MSCLNTRRSYTMYNCVIRNVTLIKITYHTQIVKAEETDFE